MEIHLLGVIIVATLSILLIIKQANSMSEYCYAWATLATLMSEFSVVMTNLLIDELWECPINTKFQGNAGNEIFETARYLRHLFEF